MAENATVSKTVRVGNEMGLHARPAAQVVHIAGRFQSELKLFRLDSRGEADCRSVLALLMLAAGKDTVLELRATGRDAAEAAAAVEEYFRRNFDEA
ncbi:MAG: HPr family phosphocarrier protein [Lentisphaeria bacterium]|nr:HPr family phosphocarrier protein [Lentisphaeria bacterium]